MDLLSKAKIHHEDRKTGRKEKICSLAVLRGLSAFVGKVVFLFF
jgi:hypothetical protein